MFIATVVLLGSVASGAVQLTADETAVLREVIDSIGHGITLGYRTLRASEMPSKPPAQLKALADRNRDQFAVLTSLRDLDHRVTVAVLDPTTAPFGGHGPVSSMRYETYGHFLSLPLIEGDTAYVYSLEVLGVNQTAQIVRLKRTDKGWLVTDRLSPPFNR